MSLDYEDKYVDGSVKIPSVDIFMYEFNPSNNSFEYNKLFGVGYKINLSKDTVFPIKKVKYNIIDVFVPNNVNKYVEEIYANNDSESSKNLDIIVINRHISLDDAEKKKDIEKINALRLTVDDKNIVLITKIYNNFVNKYYEIINNNDTVKKIISS